MMALDWFLMDYPRACRQIMVALLVALVVPISNALFETTVGLLTDLEKHQSWSAFRQHRLFKRTVFRISNISCLFALRYYADLPWYTCMSGRMGYQVLLYLLIDITITNVFELVTPPLMKLANKCFGKSSVNSLSDEANKPDFELADEYFEIVYRQYVICMGFCVMPMISLIGLIANLIEWPVDKYRLLYQCRVPRGCLVGGRRKLVLFVVFASVAGLLTFPTGLIWFSTPVLCWPCSQYTHEIVPGGGTCSGDFEPFECLDANSELAISPTEIRGQIANLKDTDDATRGIGISFFRQNDHLFSHRRCNCRPCNLAISFVPRSAAWSDSKLSRLLRYFYFSKLMQYAVSMPP
jgi:hypothetical protein